MLFNAQKIENFSLRASDGEIGKVTDLYFDDHQWHIRYLVVKTGGWLSSRQVLISPASVDAPDFENELIPVRLTRDQIESSPSIDEDKPITREYEESLHQHYDWPVYWMGPGYFAGAHGGVAVGAMPFAPEAGVMPQTGGVAAAHTAAAAAAVNQPLRDADPHLQSVSTVRGWNIEAEDGGLGHVEDLIISSQDWGVHQLVVDTRNWWPGRKVLVFPGWINDVDWVDHHVSINLDKETIKSGPEYDPNTVVSEEHESALLRHYNDVYLARR
jgi:uncharacterized protein YrrD